MNCVSSITPELLQTSCSIWRSIISLNISAGPPSPCIVVDPSPLTSDWLIPKILVKALFPVGCSFWPSETELHVTPVPSPTIYVCVLSHSCHVRLCAILWAVACQAPLSMGFSRQEYWSGLPFPSPGELLNPGIEPESLMSPALAGKFFTTSNTWKAFLTLYCNHQDFPPAVGSVRTGMYHVMVVSLMLSTFLGSL